MNKSKLFLTACTNCGKVGHKTKACLKTTKAFKKSTQQLKNLHLDSADEHESKRIVNDRRSGNTITKKDHKDTSRAKRGNGRGSSSSSRRSKYSDEEDVASGKKVCRVRTEVVLI